jgi:RNA polymerase sigma factor (sigma-70 family)
VDRRTIEALYRAHGHHVLRRARHLLGSEADARDVVQEVFASLLDHASPFRGDSAITTWLYSATTHGCLNRMRNQKTRERLLDEHARSRADGAAPASPDAERAAIVRDLLARVPDALAEIAVHYYADEMTHDEIARVLGCSRRHVGDLLERLHASLRDVDGAP